MVSAIALMAEIDKLVEDIYQQEKAADTNRDIEYHATNVIKAWYRGYMTRMKLSEMNTKALIIQRHWRGFLGRRRFRRKLNERVQELSLEYFNQVATKIQSCWRGFFARKYLADYYQRKLKLQALDETNHEMRKTLASYAENLQQRNKDTEEKERSETDEVWAASHHYLLSTEVQFGIYNSPFLPNPQPEEFLLLQTKPRVPPPIDYKKHRREDPTWREYNEPPLVSVPKLPPLKPQGPFRIPEEVLNQRIKPFRPTLRVETNYEAEEVARKKLESDQIIGQIQDQDLRYFYQMRQSYIPMIWTKSAFPKLKYGTETYRDNSNIPAALRKRETEGFRTILPPIPVFDKFGQTYSQGEV